MLCWPLHTELWTLHIKERCIALRTVSDPAWQSALTQRVTAPSLQSSSLSLLQLSSFIVGFCGVRRKYSVKTKKYKWIKYYIQKCGIPCLEPPIVEADKLCGPIFNLVGAFSQIGTLNVGMMTMYEGVAASAQIVQSNEKSGLCEQSPEWVWKMAAISGALPTSQESNQNWK